MAARPGSTVKRVRKASRLSSYGFGIRSPARMSKMPSKQAVRPSCRSACSAWYADPFV